jgi:hypothetical protein
VQVRTSSTPGSPTAGVTKARRGGRMAGRLERGGGAEAAAGPAEEEEQVQHSSTPSRAVLHRAVMAIRLGGRGLAGGASPTPDGSEAELAELEDVDLVSRSSSPKAYGGTAGEAAPGRPQGSGELAAAGLAAARAAPRLSHAEAAAAQQPAGPAAECAGGQGAGDA